MGFLRQLFNLKSTRTDYYGVLREFDSQGRAHAEDGGPAVVSPTGLMMWYRHGKLHREDGPAVVDIMKGNRQWYVNGELHREDGPAVERADGTEGWWIKGQALNHEQIAELQEKINSKAVPSSTTKSCFVNQSFRTNIPAVEFPDGNLQMSPGGKSLGPVKSRDESISKPDGSKSGLVEDIKASLKPPQPR